MSTRARGRRVAWVAVPAILALAACTPPLPEPEPDAEPAVVQPALAAVQVDRILGDLTTVLDSADTAALEASSSDDVTAALDAATGLLGPRVTGPAAQMRKVQYLLATKAGQDAITAIPPGAQTVIDPATDTWPRVMMVVTEAPEDVRAPLLLTLVQDDPRSPFRLVAWERAFGGIELPAMMQPSVGSAQVPNDGGSAQLTPDEVLAQYADLLANQSSSEYADAFGEDVMRTRIAEQRAAWAEAVDEGSVTETFQPAEDGPWALETADPEGGALVVGAITGVTTLTLSDATLAFGGPTAVLLGKDSVEKNLAITWLMTVAFSVPPATSTDPITVVGAELMSVAVSGE
jgi:hypothetical protein